MNGSNLSAMTREVGDLPGATTYEVRMSCFPSSGPAVSQGMQSASDVRARNRIESCELARRVIMRTREIEQTLLEMHAGMSEAPCNTAREIALRTALDIMHDVTRAGWERLGEHGTNKLGRWLLTTGPLVAKAPNKHPTPSGSQAALPAVKVSGTAATVPDFSGARAAHPASFTESELPLLRPGDTHSTR